MLFRHLGVKSPHPCPWMLTWRLQEPGAAGQVAEFVSGSAVLVLTQVQTA